MENRIYTTEQPYKNRKNKWNVVVLINNEFHTTLTFGTKKYANEVCASQDKLTSYINNFTKPENRY